MGETIGNHDNNTGILIGFGLLAATLFLLLVNGVLVWFASLRENVVFWTNAGGYPILLRDLVQWTYMPLLVGSALCLLGITLTSFSKICSVRFLILETTLLLLCWALLATSCFIGFKNNVLNILHGTPLHRHAESFHSPGQVPTNKH